MPELGNIIALVVLQGKTKYWGVLLYYQPMHMYSRDTTLLWTQGFAQGKSCKTFPLHLGKTNPDYKFNQQMQLLKKPLVSHPLLSPRNQDNLEMEQENMF